MKDYYEILRVSRSATAAEIKLSYRKLAVQYHPDKNKTASAEQTFKEINEAYQVLGNPGNKASYDLRSGYSFPVILTQSPPKRAHRDPAYKRRQPGVRVKGENERLMEAMADLLPVANVVAYISFAVASLFAIDYFLPSRISSESITATSKAYTRSRHNSTTWWVLTTSRGSVIDIPFGSADNFNTGDIIRIESSRLLGVPGKVHGQNETVRIRKSIYGSFSFAPIALFITSLAGIFYRKRIEYGFNTGLISLLLLGLTIVIFFLIH